MDGRFNVRTTDGEIACFGGRLPFYSFTVAHGLTYVKGNPIHLEMIYRPNGLSAASPATIEYKLTYNSVQLHQRPARVRRGQPCRGSAARRVGHAEPGPGRRATCSSSSPSRVRQGAVHAEWTNIGFEPLTIAVEPATWGSVKGMFR